MKLRFDFTAEKCSACGACAVACMDQNDIDIQHGQRSYRNVMQKERGDEYISLSITCLHCEEAPCIPVCPVGCIYKDASSLTLYDTSHCIGCRACFRVCPVEAPTFRQNKSGDGSIHMEKCHGCLERIITGLQPACVQACPTDAITWRWEENDP